MESKWISVEEKMPSDCGEDWVLVSFIEENTNYRYIPRVAEFRNGKWEIIDDYDSSLINDLKATHWMPLPCQPN